MVGESTADRMHQPGTARYLPLHIGRVGSPVADLHAVALQILSTTRRDHNQQASQASQVPATHLIDDAFELGSIVAAQQINSASAAMHTVKDGAPHQKGTPLHDVGQAGDSENLFQARQHVARMGHTRKN